MSEQPAIGFTVVGGYLGAGKTTLVNRILTGDHGRRIAVIVNDFGEVALDEALVKETSGGMRSLANGCVCCTLTDGFANALRDLAALDPRPEHVLVEVSGVGDPWAVAQWGRTPGFALDGVVVVVDPASIDERLGDRYVGDTVAAQLAAADLVLLSRADVVERSVMDAAQATIAARCPAPVLYGTDVALDLLLGRPTVGEAAPHRHAAHRSWSCRPRAADRSMLADWLARAPDEVVRAKGVIDAPDGERLLGQRVGHRVEVTRHRAVEPAEPVMTAVATAGADDAAVERWMAELEG